MTYRVNIRMVFNISMDVEIEEEVHDLTGDDFVLDCLNSNHVLVSKSLTDLEITNCTLRGGMLG